MSSNVPLRQILQVQVIVVVKEGELSVLEPTDLPGTAISTATILACIVAVKRGVVP